MSHAHVKKTTLKTNKQTSKQEGKSSKEAASAGGTFVAVDAARRYSLCVTAVGEALGEVEVD